MPWQQHCEIVAFTVPRQPDYDSPFTRDRTKSFAVCSRSSGEAFGMYDTRLAAQAAAEEIAAHLSI